MSTTIFLERKGTRTSGGQPSTRCSDQLLHRYHHMLAESRLSWTEHHRLVRLLGSGGQGVVYLSMRRGTDHFTLPVALKIFSPERYEDRSRLRRGDGPHGHRRRATSLRSSRTICWTYTIGSIAAASA